MNSRVKYLRFNIRRIIFLWFGYIDFVKSPRKHSSLEHSLQLPIKYLGLLGREEWFLHMSSEQFGFVNETDEMSTWVSSSIEAKSTTSFRHVFDVRLSFVASLRPLLYFYIYYYIFLFLSRCSQHVRYIFIIYASKTLLYIKSGPIV